MLATPMDAHFPDLSERLLRCFQSFSGKDNALN